MKPINLAIISPNENAYSETFIKAQVEKLTSNNFLYYGGVFPQYYNKKQILSLNIFKRIYRTIIIKLLIRDYNYFVSQALIKSFKKNNINAILAQYGPVGVEMLPIAKQLNIPLFVFFHGYDASTYNIINKYKKEYIELTNSCDGVFIASNTLADNLINIGCNDTKFIVNPCPPDESFFNIQPKFNYKTIISVGRFTNKKAPYLTILAFNEVVKIHLDAKLIMVGDGELLQSCKSLVKSLKIENNVIFKGVLNPKQITEQFQNSYMYVQHSITADNGDQEGTPVAILEASAASLPIVSTFHSGISQAVKHNETGYIVKELDIDKMSSCIIKLLDDPKKAKLMGEKGRKHIKENYMNHFRIIDDAILKKIK